MNLDDLEGLSDAERLAYYREERRREKAECERIRTKIRAGEDTTEAEDIFFAYSPYGTAS